MELHCADDRFFAHRAILAAMSRPFASFLTWSTAQTDACGNPMQGLLSISSFHAPPPPPAPAAADLPSDALPSLAKPVAVVAGELLPPPAPPLPPPPSAAEFQALAAESTSAEAGTGDKGDQPEARKPLLLEVQVHGISCPGAVKILLDYVYLVGTGSNWVYAPSTADENKDVLMLSRRFSLQNLHERAARWIASGVTTANVVDRLVTCHEFGLEKLRERIMASLIANPLELAKVSSSLEIMKHPWLLQDLLVQVASVHRGGPPSSTLKNLGKEEDSQEKVAEKPDAKRRKRNA